MEVHHASHSGHKKNWKEYFLEFFMLFLAVTLGFFAENIREEQVIKHQTISVLSQLRKEVILDTSSLSTMKLTHARQDTAAELITYLIRKNKLKENVRNFYLLNHIMSYRNGIFESNCLALEQLKFTGLLKNIKENDLRLAIENYGMSIKVLEGRAIREQDYMNKNIDEIRSWPFDLYKAYDSTGLNFNLVKGTSINDAVIKCNGVEFKIHMLRTFIPDEIKMKPFNQSEYLNRVIHLISIRNSTQENQYKSAYSKAITLLNAIEKYYPEALKEE